MRHTIPAPQTWNSKDWLEGMDQAADGNTHLSLHRRSYHTGYCLLGGNDATTSAWSHRRTKAQGDEVKVQKETKKITMLPYINDMLHCNQHTCNKKDECYRYFLGQEIKNSGFTFASFFSPQEPVTEGCHFFLNKKEYDKRRN